MTQTTLRLALVVITAWTACSYASVSLTDENPDILQRQANNHAAGFARKWTDKILRFAESLGIEPFSSQKLAAYDVLYRRALYLDLLLYKDPDQRRAQLLWLRADRSAEISALMKWINSVHVERFRVQRITSLIKNGDIWPVMSEILQAAQQSQVLVVDLPKSDAKTIEGLVLSLRRLPLLASIVLVDSKNLFEQLNPTLARDLTVLDERVFAPDCSDELAAK
jgi:hypothetical protein